MSDIEIVAKARELADHAVPGPWEHAPAGTYENGRLVITEYFVRRVEDDVAIASDVICPITSKPSKPNAEFIAASRELVPRLCDIIERLREEKAEMLEIIRRIPKTGLDEINAELRSQLIMVMSERDVARAALAQVNEELEGFDIPADYDDTPATRAKWAAISLRGFMQDS